MNKKKNEMFRNIGKKNIIAVMLMLLLAAMFVHTYRIGSKSTPLLGDFGKNLLIPLKDQCKGKPEQRKNQVIFHCDVPEQENLMLSITVSDCPIDMYLGKERIFHYDNIEKINLRPAYFLELPADSAGRNLDIIVEGSASQARRICDSAYIGSQRAVIEHFLHRTIYTCFISLFLLLLGGMIILANILLHRKNNQDNYEDIGFSYLGIFMMVSGIWMMNDSQFLMFFTNRFWRMGLLSTVFFCLMPVFLLLFIQKILESDGDKGINLHYFVIPHLVMMAVYLCFYAAGSPAKEYVIPVEHVFVILSLFVCLWKCFRNIRKTGSREIKSIIFGFAAFSICCIFAFTCYYFIPDIPYVGIYCLGFLIFSILLSNAAIRRIVVMIRSGAESKTYQKLAYVDLMTGLGNRTAYMKKCRDMEQPEICIMLDINGLKSVNDNQGHQEGDELIMAAARSVREAFAPLGNCFRVGGDEFVVILDVRYHAMLNDMLQVLAQSIERENQKRSFPLSIACGYAVPKSDKDSFERVYKEADEKMYTKKKEMKKILGMPQRA